MKQETSDIVKKESGALATLDFVADSGMGLENIEKSDLALPFLKLLQSGSYETKKKHAKYVEGAEAGMFYNTVTKKLYNGEKGIEIIPVFYKMTYPEWAPFEKNEGKEERPFPEAPVNPIPDIDVVFIHCFTLYHCILFTVNYKC